MMGVKGKIKGVNGLPCSHNSWLVKDTETEFGEVLICSQCGTSIMKSEWTEFHKPAEVKKESLILDVAMLYLVAYVFLLIVYVCLGGN